MDTDSKALREALQAATIRYSRDRGEPDPTPAFPFEVVFTMPQWEALQKALAAAPDSPTDSVCGMCGHSLKDNPHGFDQNDATMDGDRLVHSGSCTYCKVCQAGSGASEPPWIDDATNPTGAMAEAVRGAPAAVPSERAQELAENATKQTLMGYGAGFSSARMIEILAPICQAALTAERTDAFNLGAGGAYEDAEQVCRTERDCRAIRQRTPPDALAAIERKVSETRLAALNEFRIALRVCIEQRGNASFIAEYLPGGIFHNDTMKRIAQLQAEATRNPNESA